MTIKWNAHKHPNPDELEDYAFNRLCNGDLRVFEEHLLICEECQLALASTDDYILLMKTGTAAYAADPYVARHYLAKHGRTSPPQVHF